MDQTLVNSGFDIELLIGSRYIEYILLSFTETGSFPLKAQAGTTLVDIFQPDDVDRIYEPHPDAVPLTASSHSFASELIFGHPSGANVRTALETFASDQFLTTFSSFGLVFDTDAQGRPVNHRIRIEVLAIEVTPGIQAALGAAGITLEELLERIKEEADRDVPLPFVGAGNDVERIEMRQLPSLDGGPVAIGFYLNLRMRAGPEPDHFLGDRGDVFSAMNFLEDGRDIAFAVRKDFFADLSVHQKMQFAAPKDDGSGEFFFPMRRDMLDPTSEVVGKLIGVSVGPKIGPNGQFTGALAVIIRGEYFVDNFFDPDFTFTLTLTPHFDDGIVTWEHGTDLSSDLVAILSFVVFGFLGLIGYAIATEVVDDELVDEEQREQVTRFLQSLPTRVPMEFIRWDPFYETVHQVATRVDEWIVNGKGIAFAGRAALAKETRVVDHVVLRTEIRNPQFEVVRLDYRVRDHASHAATLDQAKVFCATDRMDFVQNADAPILFGLTAEQVVARKPAGKIVAPQDLLPKKVHLDDHKIFRMLCVTPREVEEQVRAVEDRFKRETRTRLANEQGAQLRAEAQAELEAELGTVPTPAQVEERFRQKLNALVDEAFAAYKASAQYDADIEAAVDAILLLDMAPNEYGLLQRQGIVDVLGFDLIERHNRKHRPGTVILYYRDRADFDVRDNLLNKLRYALDHARP
jgi:hypothetical protein